MNKRILLYFFLVVLTSNSLFSQSILSADRYWDYGGTPDIEWTNDDNWDGNTPPDVIDDTYINNNYSANLSSPNNIVIESVSIGANNSNNRNSTIMVPNTSGNLTIANGATLTATKGGPDGSNGVRLEGVSGNESTLTVNGTFNIESNANGDGLYIDYYSSVTVGTMGHLNVTAKVGNGIRIKDDLENSGIITITATSACLDGMRDDGPRSGSKLTNSSGASITISGGGHMRYGMYLDDIIVDNNGTVTISGTTDNILQGSMVFNNYGTFAGNGVVNAGTFNCIGSSSKLSPGTATTPIGTISFDNDIDLSGIDLDIQINSAASYDVIESLGDIEITGTDLNLSGIYFPSGSDVFTILNNTSGNPIIGIFNSLPEGSLIPFNGANLEISYNIGGSNDITLTFLGPLPVELISFTGKAQERSNLLKWQTASEENTMVFIVERSLDGARDFEEIDRIDAVGFSTSLQNYEAEDDNPVSLAYYRLRIVDFDGTFEYSDIIVVERNKTEIDLIEVFPVPAEDEVTVLIHTQTSSKAIMILSDFMGRKIKEEKIELKAGINQYHFNWEEHETNFYYLTIDNGKEKIAKKILRVSKD